MKIPWFLLIGLILFNGCEHKSTVTSSAIGPDRYETIAFKNVNLIPMTEKKVVPGQTVLIKGSIITAVGSVDDIQIPDNTLVIDGSNAYLMPGLVDMHIHTTHSWQSAAWPVSPMNLFLANGVTTVRDFGPKGGPKDHTRHWQEAIEKKRFDGPTIYGCGGILYGPVDDPAGEVTRQNKMGFHFIKPYSFLSPREFEITISTAKRLGMYTAGHIPFQVGLDGVIKAGMDEIAHVEELAWEFVIFDKNKPLVGYPWMPYVARTAYFQFQRDFRLDIKKLNTRLETDIEALAQKLQMNGLSVSSTLVVDDVIQQKLIQPDQFASNKINRFLPPEYLNRFRQGREKHQIQFEGGEDYAPFKFELDKLLLKALKKQGVAILLSTDTGGGGMGIVPGFSLHRELQILVENGFTPYEAIAAGTSQAGQVVEKMIGKNEFGTIEVGKRADLLLVNKNPLLDIAHIKEMRGVMAAGRWYSKHQLDRMLNPGIPITAVVKHVTNADRQSGSQFEIMFAKTYPGKLPDSINEIVVEGPTGKLALGKQNFRYSADVRAFWATLPGPPEIGTYIFRVTAGKDKGLATNTQSIIRNIHLPESSTLVPEDGSTLKNDSPTFTWGKIGAPLPIYYRFEIYRDPGNRIYSTGYVQNMLSHTVPEGVLKPGEAYRWRVRVTDGPDWFSVQNRTQTRFQGFEMSN